MTAVSARVTPDWLALRGPADAAARNAGGGGPADALAAWLRARCRGGRSALLVDVAAGAGAGAAWLHGRLGMPQRWLLVDHDAALLASATPVAEGWAHATVADLGTLGRIVGRAAGTRRPADAVTCQAVLDLLYPDDVRGLIDAAVRADAAVLASLTVTGAVQVTPKAPDDALVARAFDAHQRRGGRLGPDAGAFCADSLRDAGYAVTVARTPWRLGSAHGDLLVEWLHGRAAAATAQDPAHADGISHWLRQRLDLARRGALMVVVDHVDVLGLPPAHPATSPGAQAAADSGRRPA